MRRTALHLFEGFGLELEYMIVGREDLDVLPVSDEVLREIAGRYVNEAGLGEIGLSNEFVLHVIEMQNLAPAPGIKGLYAQFQSAVERINSVLEPMGALLLPTSMHPWMDPAIDAEIWNRRFRKIYGTYDRIFDCRRHGWANVQSMQVNISFSGDGEFKRLHSAARLVLPIIPALAASSPVLDGRVTGELDTRLTHYRKNQAKVPSITGSVIPEPVTTKEQYEREILEVIYKDVSPFDTEGILQYEWLNSRGAIARFDRDAIEIRLSDLQECPASDMAVATAIVEAARALVEGRWAPPEEPEAWGTEGLVAILDETIENAEAAVISDRRYLKAFGISGRSLTAGELWRHIIREAVGPEAVPDKPVREALDMILTAGPLARRILRALGEEPSKERIRQVYKRLAGCLAEGRLFVD